eukprot:12180419-Karenia_brevis.AAC.1
MPLATLLACREPSGLTVLGRGLHYFGRSLPEASDFQMAVDSLCREGNPSIFSPASECWTGTALFRPITA